MHIIRTTLPLTVLALTEKFNFTDNGYVYGSEVHNQNLRKENPGDAVSVF